MNQNKLQNPFENYNKFNRFNIDFFLKEWDEYMDEGIKRLENFVISILPEFNGLGVKYEPYWEGIFAPLLIIKVSSSTTYEMECELWSNLYDEMLKYVENNNIIPSFLKLNFRIDY